MKLIHVLDSNLGIPMCAIGTGVRRLLFELFGFYSSSYVRATCNTCKEKFESKLGKTLLDQTVKVTNQTN